MRTAVPHINQIKGLVMKYNLIVNGNLHARLANIESLKNIGLQIKNVYKDSIVSIEDTRGTNIHYFF